MNKIIFVTITIYLLLTLYLGAIMNSAVIERNGGRMPVSCFKTTSQTHFYYSNPNEIELVGLADNYYIKPLGLCYSIGDVFLFTSGAGILINSAVFIIYIIKENRKRWAN